MFPNGDKVDRLYIDTPDIVRFSDAEHKVTLTSNGCNNCVVWNCGKADNLGMSDMEENGYQRYVCVEAGQVVPPVMVTSFSFVYLDFCDF